MCTTENYRLTQQHGVRTLQSTAPDGQCTALLPRTLVPEISYEPGIGTELPVDTNAADDRGARLIVIDDDEAILNLYIEVLQDEGYQVMACDSQTDALECIRRGHPDLVIL